MILTSLDAAFDSAVETVTNAQTTRGWSEEDYQLIMDDVQGAYDDVTGLWDAAMILATDTWDGTSLDTAQAKAFWQALAARSKAWTVEGADKLRVWLDSADAGSSAAATAEAESSMVGIVTGTVTESAQDVREIGVKVGNVTDAVAADPYPWLIGGAAALGLALWLAL